MQWARWGTGWRRLRHNHALQAFVYGMAASLLLFLPFMCYDNGYFLFYGDFNVQQVPFYQMCHDAVRSGNLSWSWTTDLGANFIGSYSFYLLGSPFFWLTLPFPSAAVPYLMGPLLILKFGCASMAGYVYLRRYTKTPRHALIGGLLYAFSGFSIYNIFFNHFHEAIVIFPLVLAAMDEYVYHRRRGVFALAVFASCFLNYYFFVGQVVFCLLYFGVRCVTRSWRMSLQAFLWLAFESVLGVVMACALLVPSVLAVVQNPRVDNVAKGYNLLLYDRPQRYLHILECFFFPPDIPAQPNFTPDSDSKWASLGAWLPVFSMTGVIAFFQQKKKHWLKVLMGILFLFAMVPILNSTFQMFNAMYYARWFYMLTLMMILATVLCLDLDAVDWRRALLWTGGITLGIALPVGLLPKTTTQDGVETTTIGLEAYPTRFWSYVAIAVLGLALAAFLLRSKNSSRKWYRVTMGSIALVSVVYGAFFIALGKTQGDDTHGKLIPYSLNGGADLNLPDLENVRSDFYKAMDNQGMYWQIPTIQAFHSIVPGSIMEFYPTIGVSRDVGSRPDVKYYGLRGLTSCRWLFDYAGDSSDFSDENGVTKMPGWVYYDHQNGYDIWENQYYIPMGFSYDYYVSRGEYDSTPESSRNLLLLKALVLSDAQIERYGSLLEPLSSSKTIRYTTEDYYQDCTDRQSMSALDFSRDNRGFTAHFEAEKERLVFFSVPYEGGWSATVNGEPAEIEKVNVGFMAVKVPAGTSEIRFTYQTPGLKAGLLASAGGVGVFLLYVFGMGWLERRRARALGLARLPLDGEVNDSGFPEGERLRSPRKKL